MVGEVQKNEESENVWPESLTIEISDQPQNDFMTMQRVPVSEVVNKRKHHTRWVLKEKKGGESVRGRLAMKRFKTWKDDTNEIDAGTPTLVWFNLFLVHRQQREWIW